MISLHTDGLNSVQRKMVLVALQLRKESAEENNDARDAKAWAKVISILTTPDVNAVKSTTKGNTMAKAKEVKAAKTVRTAKTTAKTPGQKAAAKIPAWKQKQEEVDKSVAKGIRMLRERKPAKPAEIPDYKRPLENGTFGTYYPVSNPNGLACYIVWQRASGRYLIFDLSYPLPEVGMEDAGGGSYILPVSGGFKLRTVTATNLNRSEKWLAIAPGIAALKPYLDTLAEQFKSKLQ